MNTKVRQLVTILFVAATIFVNTLANTLPINGQNTGEVSDSFPIYFVPAGYVFSIWGLIYLGLIGFAIYQAFPSQREDPLQQKIAPWVWLGSAANIAWIFLWHYERFPLTLVAMLILLASLLVVFVQISRVRAGTSRGTSRLQRWLVDIVFAVYLGWITVATVANVSQVLYSSNWNAWGIAGPVWAAIMVAVASVLGLLMLWRERSIPYTLVLLWAFIGIAVKHAGTVTATAAWIGVAVVGAASVAAAFIKQPRLQEG
ncbi:MAG: tryptophan-rich sensory protein [Anaerolineales bacterium]|nr:tryptophan-rich sensory protein [Anaerolineales bacterium]